MSVDLMSLCFLIELPSSAQKLVALKLADCANDEGENIFPSVGRIARETILGTSTVRRVLAAFEQAGVLEVVKEAHGNKWDRSTTVRRFNVECLHDLAPVEIRHGEKRLLTPSTHVLKNIGDSKKENWVVIERAAGDHSAYTPLPQREGQKSPLLPERDGTPPSGGGDPSRSGTQPLPLREGAPPGAGSKPSIEPSLNQSPPSPPKSGGESAKCDWKGRALAELRKGDRNLDAVEHLIAPLLASGKRLSLGEPLPALRELAEAAQGLDAAAFAATVKRLLEHPHKLNPQAILKQIDIAKRAGAMIMFTRGSPQWKAWHDHFQKTEPLRAQTMPRFEKYQVASEWPPRRSEEAA